MKIFVKYTLSLRLAMTTLAKENFCPGISGRVADPDRFDPDPTLEEPDHFELLSSHNNVCTRSSDPFYVVFYYIKWVTTTWTYSISRQKSQYKCDISI